MDLSRQLDPISVALVAVLERDDLAGWARQALTDSLNSLSDVINTIGEPECQWCGVSISTTSGPVGRPRSFCSNAHRQAAYRDAVRSSTVG
jgi:hypothetical protein